MLIVTDKALNDRRLVSYIRADLEFLPDDMKGDMVFTSKKNFKHNVEKLYRDIRRDGIILWKKGEFTDEYKQLLPTSEE